mmetsp:Transcript_6279/g.20136  ORF Transcript_6279/g.20136 Transcript_6279/m.20136 type:complete len:225 (-) Transcript_6279:150-824(-)
MHHQRARDAPPHGLHVGGRIREASRHAHRGRAVGRGTGEDGAVSLKRGVALRRALRREHQRGPARVRINDALHREPTREAAESLLAAGGIPRLARVTRGVEAPQDGLTARAQITQRQPPVLTASVHGDAHQLRVTNAVQPSQLSQSLGGGPTPHSMVVEGVEVVPAKQLEEVGVEQHHAATASLLDDVQERVDGLITQPRARRDQLPQVDALVIQMQSPDHTAG